jgi:hypothetical protein
MTAMIVCRSHGHNRFWVGPAALMAWIPWSSSLDVRPLAILLVSYPTWQTSEPDRGRFKRLINHLLPYRLHAADPFTLRQADQARTDFAIIEDEREAIHKRLSQLPTRNEVWQAAMLEMLGGRLRLSL